MKSLSASFVIALTLCLPAAVIAVVAVLARSRPAEPAAGHARDESPLETLRAHADATSAAACTYADALVDAGRAAEAEEWYLAAVEKDPGCAWGRTILERAYAPLRIRGAGSDPAKLDALVAWLRRARMEAQALDVAEHLARLSPDCPNAQRLLAEIRRDPARLEQEFRAYLEARGAESGTMSAHDRSLLRERWLACRDFEVPEDGLVARDTGPRAPFLLLLERSGSYSAELIAGALAEAVTAVAERFSAEFGPTFDPAHPDDQAVTVIYVFESRERYAARAGDATGTARFDPRSGRVACTRQESTSLEPLLHACTKALVHRAWIHGNPGTPDLGATRAAWLDQGLAEYFASFRRDASGAFLPGELSPDCARRAKRLVTSGKAIPLRDLLSVTCLADRQRAATEDGRAAFAAQAWALVYYLEKSGNEKDREALRAYFAREMTGRGGAAAAEECFGDLVALDRRFQEFWKNLK